MVNILETLTAGQGGKVVGNLAQSYGLDRKQAADVLSAVVPELAFNIERQSFNRGGLADLVAALGKADYTEILRSPAGLTSPAVQQAGIAALDTLLWSKDRSRTVAYRAARATGVDEALIRQMLPAIAALVMGGIASKADGTLATIAGEVGAVPVSKAADIGVGDQRPLPIPGERIPSRQGDNPFGDLPDIIRRGGTRIPGGGSQRSPSPPRDGGGIELPPGGADLDKIIRDVLGGIVGFQSNSVIGWIIRYFLVRWGWNFIQGILRRLFARR